MALIITEGKDKLRLNFEFSDNWIAYKYDEPSKENFYFSISNLGLKAVDVVAKSNKCLLFMEIKYIIAADSKSKMSFISNSGEAMLGRLRDSLSESDRKKVTITSIKPYIVDEVVKKTKDTILGLLASQRQSDKRLAVFNRSLFCDNQQIILILFLERNEKLNEPEYFKPMASNLKKCIEQKIGFFGNIQVLVVNSLTISPELGIKVTKYS
ncbi:MAG: hypothetical protein NTX45_20185 [Proteobacteria bacterium]|nr:hypothetical protein [Pseudomonadota bacterium]